MASNSSGLTMPDTRVGTLIDKRRKMDGGPVLKRLPVKAVLF